MLQDADECIRLAPTFAKGYSRKGHLQFFMKEHEQALKTYEEGLRADPGNEELREGMKRCYEAMSKVPVFCCCNGIPAVQQRLHC